MTPTIADATDELKYRLGVSDFVLASAAYDNRDMVLAAERLDNVPPEQRGWEWRYLKRQTRGGLFTLYGHTAGDERGVQPGRRADRHRQLRQDGEGVGRADGHALLDLKGHTGAVSSVAFSPDGTRIVTGSRDETAKVWDARTGTSAARPQGAHERVNQRGVQPRRHADRHRQ